MGVFRKMTSLLVGTILAYCEIQIRWIVRFGCELERSKEVMKAFYFKTTKLWQLLAVTLLILLGTIGMGGNAAYAATMVPFRGSYSGSADWNNGAPLFSGTGISSHLGKGTNEGYVVFTTAPVSCAGGVPNDNYETLTAANGDSLAIVSHDVGCPIGPGEYHGTGHWEVLGGTGRFSGATGQGTLDGHADFNHGVFSFLLIGTISAPNGNWAHVWFQLTEMAA
jgi:hypothetical protein